MEIQDNVSKAKELRQFVCNTHMANGGKALNMLSLHNQRNADLENIWKLCEKTALAMAEWKDEQNAKAIEICKKQEECINKLKEIMQWQRKQFAAEKQALIDNACDLILASLIKTHLFINESIVEFVIDFRKLMEETK